MERSTMEVISERLSGVEDLYFPRSTFSSGEAPSDSSVRKKALLDLLSRDAPLFLERYGGELTVEELSEFDALKQDYEVSWHLNRIRISRSPTAEETRLRSAAVKNRRRAYLEQLIRGGVYFSEEAMREREPYLHHEYVGRFQDPSGRGMSRPGERWSETLMRRSEEAIIVAKIRTEQQRLGVARKDWIGNEGIRRKSDDGVKIAELPGACRAVSTVELRDQLEQFTHIMHQKFLAGEDSEYLDYSSIDNNERLDDHWLKESNQDAEERYFAED
ncbi:unnamed protein product [Spirodela intermedia]|uniref:CCD97-like C-terminal domain-containing protein n=1 Tax=Spirodela intermedia TaxID=51605 RepID=A0A7I8JJ17_SPIIN|nr:unnamed protein product [Spirodela intermedia]CAA6669765.1 unnamed protein product [Spirodela intermedia]